MLFGCLKHSLCGKDRIKLNSLPLYCQFSEYSDECVSLSLCKISSWNRDFKNRTSVLPSIAVIVLLNAYGVWFFTKKSLFVLAPVSFWHNPTNFLRTYLLSGITRYLRLILYILFPRQGISHFSKKLCFFLVGNCIFF